MEKAFGGILLDSPDAGFESSEEIVAVREGHELRNRIKTVQFMEMDVDATSKAKDEEEGGNAVLVILVGAPGSGKSTFCERVMQSSTRPWVRVCQDTIGNGKAGTKAQCLKAAASALSEGKNVFTDRCNLDREQRTDFVKLGGPRVDVHALVLDLPAQLCISRSVKRTGHEGNLQGGKAAAVVNRMLQKKELPKLTEGFTRITFCQSEGDVQSSINAYSSLGPLDSLPPGCFGQKNSDTKVQLGIMKFLKKVDSTDVTGSNANDIKNPVLSRTEEKKAPCSEISESSFSIPSSLCKDNEEVDESGLFGSNDPFDDAPTLAFPSLSTADFQFNLERASDIIVEKVEEFMNRLGRARLVLVDLSHGSKILSLVKAKATQRNINSRKFLTFVGDITRLYSARGLRCNVIANAANWRLKPGGGGVNAAIFSAAGPALEVATKQEANSLQAGSAVVVPLPSSSPLYGREGVTHVIHVLGPNMNPQRPNFLYSDYDKGSKLLRAAYNSLFESFLSIVEAQDKSAKRSGGSLFTRTPQSEDHCLDGLNNAFSSCEHKTKREDIPDTERSKKSRGSLVKAGANPVPGTVTSDNDKVDESRNRAWGSWAQALYNIAVHPEKHRGIVLEISDDYVILNDLYPKAQKHVLVLARSEGLSQLADVRAEHLELLRTMHAVGLKWAGKFLNEDASLIFRLGYHSAPSMRQLHLHVISQDFNSTHLKNKKHWNSFNTAFFRDSVDVIKEVSRHGRATLNDDDSLMSKELRCNRCLSAHPNIPRLKSHIGKCQAPFPSNLLENSRLVRAPVNPAIVKP